MKPTPITHLDPTYAVTVWARIESSSTASGGGCRIWSGSLDHSGYGKIKVLVDGRIRQTGAHRAAWLSIRGDIPASLQIDHLCRVRACVNPDHMELVTNQMNSQRADHSGKAGRSGKRRGSPLHSCGTHGREDGYEWTGRSGYTRWVCRPCRREISRRQKSRAQVRSQG
mgnify:CR=1 FL=1